MVTSENFKKVVVPGLLLFSAGALLYACRSVKVPSYATILEDFDLKKYAGKWHEIARFDFKYEKNLKNVTAQYTLNDDGTIRVVNRGFNTKKQQWEEVTGKAKPVESPTRSALKVSFFGPFYAGYNVVMISPDYQNALVFGESKNYIWILSREKTIPAATKKKFLQKAKEAGYDLERLVWTVHDEITSPPRAVISSENKSESAHHESQNAPGSYSQ